MAQNTSVSTGRLIAVPAVITLGITVLRLVGELRHWPAPWFSSAAGGGGAVVGISWLPLLFGPCFAIKLARAGLGPPSFGKAIGFSLLGLAILIAAGVTLGAAFRRPSVLVLLVMLVMLVAAFVPGMGWRQLGKTLLAYAFAARIPVLIVMFIAMQANSGRGWGTHYDAVTPQLANASFLRKFTYEALFPQMTLWIGYTVVVGALLGSVVAALMRARKPAQASA
jgi:hypothetical protein